MLTIEAVLYHTVCTHSWKYITILSITPCADNCTRELKTKRRCVFSGFIIKVDVYVYSKQQ